MLDLRNGDCLEVLKDLDPDSVDSIVTDPPYGISFMARKWDYDVPSAEIWAQCLRVLKPGGHLLAFAGTRTQHRMCVNIEDAGFEIRDMIAWVYGSGFPKSMNVGKAIDKHGGQSVAWFGPWFRKWRKQNGITQKQVSALFPSKTGGLTGCVANWELGLNMPTPEQFNLIRDTFGLPFESVEAAKREVVGQRTTGIGTGGGSTPIMGDGNRDITAPATPEAQQWDGWGTALKPALEPITVARKPFKGTVASNVLEHGTGAINIDACRVGGSDGRWPANLIHDGSEEVVELFGDAQRFFYCAKANKKDRDEGCEGLPDKNPIFGASKGDGLGRGISNTRQDVPRKNTHPTVKPTDLMSYLCRLVTPPGGIVLDPFMGSGSTGKAAIREGFGFIGIEREPDYYAIAQQRVSLKEDVQLGLIA